MTLYHQMGRCESIFPRNLQRRRFFVEGTPEGIGKYRFLQEVSQKMKEYAAVHDVSDEKVDIPASLKHGLEPQGRRN